MKDLVHSSLRHVFTALAALGTYLALHGAVGPDDVDAVNAAGASLGDGLSVIVAALVARLFLWLSGKAMWPAGDSKTSGSGVTLLALCLCIGSLAVGGLSGCSGVPVRVGIVGPDGTLSYSSKGGLAIDARVHAAK